MRHEIFPTPVWQIEGTPQELIDELLQGAYKCKDNIDCQKRSNQEGYQSPSFTWNEFHPKGIKYIEGVLKEHLIDKNDDNLFINGAIAEEPLPTSWWFNINPKGAWNIPHTHPSVDFAGVLYLTDIDNELCFISHNNRFNTGHLSPPAKKGDLIVFPSDQIHMVMPNKSEKDRVSISMNITVTK